MTEKLLKPILKGGAFAIGAGLAASLVVTLLLFFELMGVALAAKVLYGVFVFILFATAFITARKIGSRGLFVGLGLGGAVILLGIVYRLIGVEAGLNLAFLIRSVVTGLIATVGAVLGVNTVK